MERRFFFFLLFLKGTRGNLFVFVTLSLLLLSTTLLVYIYRETIERFAGIKFYFSTRFSTFDILIRPGLNNLNSLSSSSYSSWSWQNHRFFEEKYIRLFVLFPYPVTCIDISRYDSPFILFTTLHWRGIFLDQPILPCTHSTILQLFFETFPPFWEDSREKISV